MQLLAVLHQLLSLGETKEMQDLLRSGARAVALLGIKRQLASVRSRYKIRLRLRFEICRIIRTSACGIFIEQCRHWQAMAEIELKRRKSI